MGRTQPLIPFGCWCRCSRWQQSLACLFRPSLVSDELLAEPPRRVAQLQPEARRHLKVKLAAYWGRVAVDPKELPLQE